MRSPLVNPAVADAWFDTLRPNQQPLVQALRRIVTETAPSLALAVKWGNLVFLHRGRHALAIVAYKEHVGLQVFAGASLTARYPQLEGSGKDVRHLRLRPGDPLDEAMLRQLTLDAIDAMQ